MESQIKEAYREPCKRLAMNILGRLDAAEACVSDVFLTVDVTSARDGARLIKTTRALALDRYVASHDAKRGEYLFESVLDELSSVIPKDVDTVGSTDPARVTPLLCKCLRSETPDARDVFICRYFYGDTVDEIARRFGLSDSRIEALLRRTRTRLSRRIAAEGLNLSDAPFSLAFAMGEISDRAVTRARTNAKMIRRFLPLVLAVCVIIVAVHYYPDLREMIDSGLKLNGAAGDDQPNGDEATPSIRPDAEDIFGVNIPKELGTTTVTVTAYTESTVTLTLVKEDNTPIYAAFYDLLGYPLATTEAGYKLNGQLLQENVLKVTVDDRDTPVYELPSAIGTYTVTVDFSGVRHGAYPMLDHIGLYAYVGENGKAETIFFSVLLPEDVPEADTTAEIPID